jgi:hypothetical protein
MAFVNYVTRTAVSLMQIDQQLYNGILYLCVSRGSTRNGTPQNDR